MKIIDVFGKQLYSLNGEELVYSEMGKRLGDQRNHFAHGDLDKDFIDLSLLDLIFLERIVHAMQLKYYGIETRKIQCLTVYGFQITSLSTLCNPSVLFLTQM